MDTRNDGSWNMFVRFQIWLVILGRLNFRGRSRLIFFPSVTCFFGFAVWQTKNPKHSELLRQSTVGCQLQTFSVQFDDFRQIWSLQARMQDCLQQQFPHCSGEGEGYIFPGNCRPWGILKGQWWLITLNTVDGSGILRSPLEVSSLSYCLHGLEYIQTVVVWDF